MTVQHNPNNHKLGRAENNKSSKRKRIHCKMSYGRLFGCAIFCVAIPVEVCYHTL